ncbi:alpha/beta fold hydrolase [Flavobacteriales bacterium]|nr:alpha/beta fold hydrolase [Flavobacteriales bacterium]
MRLTALSLIVALASLGFLLASNSPSEEPTIGLKTLEFWAADQVTPLQLDLHSSPVPSSVGLSKSLFVFVHGGGFFSGSRNHPLNAQFCTALAKHGIDVASIDYRLLQQGRGFHCDIPNDEKRAAIQAAAADLEQAIALLKPDYPNGIVIGGSSAGGHAVLHAAYKRQLVDIQGVISISGAMEPIKTTNPTPLLAFHGTCDALVPYGEAIHHCCNRNESGALLLHGGGALAECLPQVQLHAYLNAGHDLANTLLSDSTCIATCADFIQNAINAEEISGILLYETNQDCGLPRPFLPCQP